MTEVLKIVIFIKLSCSTFRWRFRCIASVTNLQMCCNNYLDHRVHIGISQNRRIIESLRVEGTSWDHLQQPCSLCASSVSYSRLIRIVSGWVWESPQERLHNLSGQPVPVFNHPHGKKNVFLCSDGISCASVCAHVLSPHHLLDLLQYIHVSPALRSPETDPAHWYLSPGLSTGEGSSPLPCWQHSTIDAQEPLGLSCCKSALLD